MRAPLKVAQDMPRDVLDLMSEIGFPFDKVAHNCHAVSLAIVKSNFYPGSRVARGWCKGVVSQHSWVALGDPYDDHAGIVDATLWSYDPKVTGIWTQGLTGLGWRHRPHGYGHFLRAGMPSHHGGTTIDLAVPVSEDARDFLAMMGPLDTRGWVEVASLPMQGWPSREIIEAMLDTPALAGFVPIDIQGMVTDRNPAGLYMIGDEK